MEGEERINSRDTLLDLLYEETGSHRYSPIRPPSAPKPVQKTTRPPRRASSIIRSPYLVAAPRPLSHQATPPSSSTCTSAPSSSGHRNVFVTIKRKRTTSCNNTKVTNNDFTEDFSGKTALDLRDELTATKRTFAATEGERDWMKGEIIKLKQVLEKKDKEIEDLILGGHVSSRDRARISTGNKTDVLLAMSSYKHRIHTLERSIRDKDSQILALKSDIKTSRLKELEIEKETFIGEILRLREVVEYVLNELDHQVPQSKKHLSARLEETERQVIELRSRYKAVHSERETLLKRLGFWKENDTIYPENDERAAKFLTLSQGAAITALVQLELTIEEKLREINQCHKDHAQLMETHQSEMNALSQEMQEKDNTIEQLKVTESNYTSLQDEFTSLKTELSVTQNSLEEEKRHAEETMGVANSLKQEAEAERVAREYAQQLSKRKSGKRLVLLDKGERTQSALVIQRQWRIYRSKKRQQQFEMEQNEMIILLQSTIRGHLTRHNYITTNVLVSPLQSLLSAHSVRRHFLSSEKDTSNS